MWFFLISLSIIYFYFYVKFTYSFWKLSRISFIPPTFPFGNLKDVVLRRQSFGLLFRGLYQRVSDRYIGVFMFFRPVLFIRDAALAKRILTEDFKYFHDRGLYINEENDPVSASLFNLTGSRWREMRKQITPAFTSGKLKGMFEIIREKSSNLVKYLEPLAEKSEEIDFKDECTRYSIDIIGSAVFGIDVNTIEDRDNKFKKLLHNFTNPNWLTSLRQLCLFLCPSLLMNFGIHGFCKELQDFFVKIIYDTALLREDEKIVRKDVIQLLLQLRNSGTINEGEEWGVQNSSHKKSLTLKQISGHSMTFFIAGAESSSKLISYCLYELARFPDATARLQEEIDDAMVKYGGEISYDSLQEMKYLELCVQETMRKYPGLPILNRQCTIDYQIPGTNHVIKKGTGVVISAFGIQNDPHLFPEPDKFFPGRFLTDNINHKYMMAFGDGPRTCIGFRLGKLATKAAIVSLLSKYTIEETKNTKLEFEKGAIGLLPRHGIRLRVS